MRTAAWYLALLAACASPSWAIKPLVSGDVPTAEKGLYEVFVGYLVTYAGSATVHEVPFWEVVYGLTQGQELTIEAPLLVHDGSGGSTAGIGDVILGTKYRLLGEPLADSGLSASLEIALPTGDSDRSLGSGAVDVDLRLRGGWQFGSEVVYLNLGHTWLGEDDDEPRDNTWFYAAVWDHPVGTKLRLLTEFYRKTADDPEASDRLAATVGIKWHFPHRQQLQLSIGRSLRSGAQGGPDVRFYVGWRRDF